MAMAGATLRAKARGRDGFTALGGMRGGRVIIAVIIIIIVIIIIVIIFTIVIFVIIIISII